MLGGTDFIVNKDLNLLIVNNQDFVDGPYLINYFEGQVIEHLTYFNATITNVFLDEIN